MRDVWVLTLAQALAACGTIMVATFGGILGAVMAPSPMLATLPLSLSVLGTAATSLPAARLMQRVGRRRAFVGSALVGAVAAWVCAASVHLGSFAGLCVAAALLGGNMAFVQQYRFAAAEFVEPAHAGRAVSTVMVGTLGAALLAPELGDRARLLGGWSEFTGSFVVLGGLLAAAAGVLTTVGEPRLHVATAASGGRPLAVVARQPAFLAALGASVTAYAVMSFIMAATPVSMHVVDGHSTAATKSVISAHLLGMFGPSLASAVLLRWMGVRGMMAAGLACMAACVAIGAVVGQHVVHYFTALVLLGVGWNFLFVSGTTLLTTTYAPSERFAAQGLNDVVVFGTQAMASLLAGPAILRLGWPTLNMTALPMLAAMAGAVVWLGVYEGRVRAAARTPARA